MKIVIFLNLILCDFIYAETISREELSELYKIRSEIKKAVFDQSRYQQDILKMKLDIENKNLEIKKNKLDTDEIKEKILNRISDIYKIHKAYPQGFAISFSKEEDFLRKSYYLRYLNAQDKNLISNYKDKIETSKKLQNKLQSYMNKLLDLQSRGQKQFAELKIQEVKQREIVKKIRKVVKGQNPYLEEKVFFSELRGQLEPPVMKGELKGQLGISRDPKTKITLLETGVLVAAENNSNVQSIHNGEVVYADNLAGWGQTVIIDHGEYYYSVYSHLKKLSVRLGEHVISRQKLAEVAAVPYHKKYDKPGVYFEIRHFSEPEDPRLWLKGAQ